MADTKITALAVITTVDPANDVLPIVDVSNNSMAASGTTCRVTTNQLLGAGGTATLASASISGDLTVATNRLAVSASGVGIGTTTMTYNLNVTGTAPTVTGIKLINTSGTSSNLCMFSASSAYSSFGVPNNAGWLAVEGSNPLAIGPTGNGGIVFVNNGSEAMRLNSTGLGVGVTPLGRLHVRQSGAGIQDVGLLENAQAAAADVGPRLGLLGVGSVAMATVESGWNGAANTDAYLSFRTRGSGAVTERLRIDSSGNVGISRASTGNKLEAPGVGIDGRTTVGGVSTVATTIYTIKQSATAAMCVVFGDDGSNGFCDIVLFLATVAPKVVSSQTLYGSPAARTYSTSTTNLQLALASGTLSIRTAALSTLNT